MTTSPNKAPNAPSSGPANAEALDLVKQIMMAATQEHLGLLGTDIERRIDAAQNLDSVTSCIAKWNMAMRGSLSGRNCVDEHLNRIQLLLN